MKKSGMTAKALRGILIFVIFVMIGASATGIYFAQKWLLALAGTISQTVADSNSSGNNSQAAAQLQAELAAQQSVIEKTSLISVSRQNYQSKAIQDLDQSLLEKAVGRPHLQAVVENGREINYSGNSTTKLWGAR